MVSLKGEIHMQIVDLICRMHFNAAHRLHNPQLSDQENIKIFGVCNNKNGHGHNYIIEVYVSGPIDEVTGYVINITDLKHIIKSLIIDECDHKHLNLDVEWLKDINPTSENLVVAFWKRLVDQIPKAKLNKIRLYETENNIVEYSGPKT